MLVNLQLPNGPSVYEKLKSSEDAQDVTRLKRLEEVMYKYDIPADAHEVMSEGILRLDLMTSAMPNRFRDSKTKAFYDMLKEFRS